MLESENSAKPRGKKMGGTAIAMIPDTMTSNLTRVSQRQTLVKGSKELSMVIVVFSKYLEVNAVD